MSFRERTSLLVEFIPNRTRIIFIIVAYTKRCIHAHFFFVEKLDTCNYFDLINIYLNIFSVIKCNENIKLDLFSNLGN